MRQLSEGSLIGVIDLWHYNVNVNDFMIREVVNWLRVWCVSDRGLMNKIILIYNFHNRLIYITEYQLLPIFNEKT